jgi:hypothetical protein
MLNEYYPLHTRLFQQSINNENKRILLILIIPHYSFIFAAQVYEEKKEVNQFNEAYKGYDIQMKMVFYNWSNKKRIRYHVLYSEHIFFS